MKLLVLSQHMVSKNWILNFFETWSFDYDHVTSHIFLHTVLFKCKNIFGATTLTKAFLGIF